MNEITKKKISCKLKGRKKLARTKFLISEALKDKEKTGAHKEAISLGMIEFWKRKKE